MVASQYKRQSCTLVPISESVLVQIDYGNILLAGITPYACKEMVLQEGYTVYCLVKTHAFCYVAEMEAKPVR